MTAEQTAWMKRADEALDDAFLLKDKERFDRAVSTAYYAMFYAATATLLTSPGQTFKRHSTVHNMFLDHWVKSGRIESDYHRYLSSAFDARSKADYSIAPSATAEIAQLHYLHAEAFIRRVRELLQP